MLYEYKKNNYLTFKGINIQEKKKIQQSNEVIFNIFQCVVIFNQGRKFNNF